MSALAAARRSRAGRWLRGVGCLAAGFLLLALSFSTAAAQAVPPDARFAASSRGQVYYPIGCPAWRELSPRNLLFFPSADAAEAAGYRPTTNRRCLGPSRLLEAPAEVDGRRVAGGCVVVRIIDGDTVDCEGGARIRLLLIDAPETGQGSYGLRAKLALEELLAPGDTAGVEVDVEERDRYGRVLGHLHAHGVWVNRALARAGYVVPLVYPPNVLHVEAIRAAADSARVERRGLWEVDAFECLPRDFRAGRCGG